MWALSSLTRIEPMPPTLKLNLNHWTASEVPVIFLIDLKQKVKNLACDSFIYSFKLFLNCKAFFSFLQQWEILHLHFKKWGLDQFCSWSNSYLIPALCFQWAGAGFLFESTEWGAEETPVWEHCGPSERRTKYPEESGEWYFVSRTVTRWQHGRVQLRRKTQKKCHFYFTELSKLKKTSMNLNQPLIPFFLWLTSSRCIRSINFTSCPV